MLPFLAPLLANPLLRTACIALGAFLAGFFYCWASVPTVDIPAIVRNAEAARDAVWQAKLNEESKAHEQNLKDAIAARDSTAPALVTDADVSKLCEQSPTCRDKSPGGGKRVRSFPANHVGKGRHKANSGAGASS